MTDEPTVLGSLRALARATPGLQLLVLFGSRARHDTWDGSDWDLGYIGEASFDPDAFLARMIDLLGSERIDLVDLDRAGGQLRYRVARDGYLLHADRDARYERFWLDAVSFWCDAQTVLRKGYDRVLRELGR
jgi:predicted nucleotidyltransferase